MDTNGYTVGEYIIIGKIVNTHGIKGELRLRSSFKYKPKVFVKDMKVYIGTKKIPSKITGYRVHKCFDMITLEGYNDINQVLPYKGCLVYIYKEDLNLAAEEYLDDDLIGLKVVVKRDIRGRVNGIRDTGKGNRILSVVTVEEEVALVPLCAPFVEKIDFKTRKIYVNPIKGMLL